MSHVKCPNALFGCSYHAKTMHEIEKHNKNCMYKRIRCGQCQEYIIFRDFLNHINNHCPNRIAKCETCKNEYLYKDLRHHFQTCSKSENKEICQMMQLKDFVLFLIDEYKNTRKMLREHREYYGTSLSLLEAICKELKLYVRKIKMTLECIENQGINCILATKQDSHRHSLREWGFDLPQTISQSDSASKGDEYLKPTLKSNINFKKYSESTWKPGSPPLQTSELHYKKDLLEQNKGLMGDNDSEEEIYSTWKRKNDAKKETLEQPINFKKEIEDNFDKDHSPYYSKSESDSSKDDTINNATNHYSPHRRSKHANKEIKNNREVKSNRADNKRDKTPSILREKEEKVYGSRRHKNKSSRSKHSLRSERKNINDSDSFYTTSQSDNESSKSSTETYSSSSHRHKVSKKVKSKSRNKSSEHKRHRYHKHDSDSHIRKNKQYPNDTSKHYYKNKVDYAPTVTTYYENGELYFKRNE